MLRLTHFAIAVGGVPFFDYALLGEHPPETISMMIAAYLLVQMAP
ncbi:MAG: hypothetical protein QF921_16180 [Pseudomonadales bacterium]|nr:hypothetical protein [Pseudomonadales bacterium]MDP6828278.1 hypothetical protein [Pseudomonadales bacterium]MDP6973022.1 hypothetical protein [Pseudomonadales bacterium]